MAKKSGRTSDRKRTPGGAGKGSPTRKAKAAAGKRSTSGAKRETSGAKRGGRKPGKSKAPASAPAARKATTGVQGDRRSLVTGSRGGLALAATGGASRGEAAGATEGVDLEVFREQVRFLEESFDELAAACETAAQRTALSRNLATAQNNLARAVSAVFESGDVRVRELEREMREGQAEIEQLQISEQNIADALSLITGVVRAGASLVALAT
jgi:hypothetical protein